MSVSTTPKISVVRDAAGRNVVYLDASFDQNMVVSEYGPRYQQHVVRGGPVTIHFDSQLEMFQLSPMAMKDVLGAPRYQHIVDLPECLHDSDEDSGGKQNAIAGDTDVNEDISSDSHIPSSPAVKIPRPPNSWILYRKDKSKELRQANPGMSAGEISTEASRQWKVEQQAIKDYYQALADEEARLHKIRYPDYRYKPRQK